MQKFQDRDRNDAQRHLRSRGRARLKVSFQAAYTEQQQKREMEAGKGETRTQRSHRGCPASRRDGGSCPVAQNRGMKVSSRGEWTSHSTCTPFRFITLNRG